MKINKSESYDLNLGLNAEETNLFNEIMGQLKSGQEVWLPRTEDADIIDLFKYKKYQGSIQLVDEEKGLYNAYRANPERPDESLELINTEPDKFDIVAKLLLAIVDSND